MGKKLENLAILCHFVPWPKEVAEKPRLEHPGRESEVSGSRPAREQPAERPVRDAFQALPRPEPRVRTGLEPSQRPAGPRHRRSPRFQGKAALDRGARVSHLGALCVAEAIEGRIAVSEPLLRGGCRTDPTAGDDANGPAKRPPVRSRPAHGTGTSPIADLDPQGIAS